MKYVPISMGDYKYPVWGEVLGFMISFSSMLWVPGKTCPCTRSNLVDPKQISNLQLIICSGYAIYYFFTTRGTWREVLAAGVTPVIKARPEALLAEIKYNEARAGERKDVELSLLDPPTTEAVPGRDGSTLLSQEEDEDDQRSSRCGTTSCVEEEPPAYPAVL